MSLFTFSRVVPSKPGTLFQPKRHTGFDLKRRRLRAFLFIAYPLIGHRHTCRSASGDRISAALAVDELAAGHGLHDGEVGHVGRRADPVAEDADAAPGVSPQRTFPSGPATTGVEAGTEAGKSRRRTVVELRRREQAPSPPQLSSSLSEARLSLDALGVSPGM